MVPLNLPNALTMLRILMVPVVVVALLAEIPNGDLVAGVVFAEPSTAAIGASRSSGIDAIPTFSLPYAPAGTPVSAVKSVVLPAPGRPTSPTSSGT